MFMQILRKINSQQHDVEDETVSKLQSLELIFGL